jgi:predicted transcriptional regulator
MLDKVAKGRQHRGEATGGVVLSDAKVAEILTAYATREFSVIDLAREYGVTEATLRAIVNGKTWTHVPGPRLSREEIVAIGKKRRADGRIAAKKATGWQPGACSVCRERGHYAKTCPMARKSA